jgi:hypothetical protein
MGLGGANKELKGASGAAKLKRRLAPLVVVLIMILAFATATPTHAQTIPGNIILWVPITITNSQSTSTPAPFEMLLQVSSSTYASSEASNLQNVEFFDSNGAVIPSWLQGGNSNTASATFYWLRLANAIAAGSSVTIYMGFASTSTNLLNAQTTGEAPDLSSSYGQYDDGANVFAYYWNFAGTSLPSGWTFTQASGNQGGYSVNNGASFYTGSGGSNALYAYFTTALSTNSYVISTKMQSYQGGNNGEGVWFGWWSAPSSPSSAGNYNGNYVSDWIWCPFFNCYSQSGDLSTFDVVSNGGTAASSNEYNANLLMTYSMSWSGSAQTGTLYPPSGGQVTVTQAQGSPSPGSYYLGFWDNTAGQGNNGETALWVSVSTMPPNGVMPSASFGSQTNGSGTTTSPTSPTTTATTTTTVTTTVTSTTTSTSRTTSTVTTTTTVTGGTATATTTVTSTQTTTSTFVTTSTSTTTTTVTVSTGGGTSAGTQSTLSTNTFSTVGSPSQTSVGGYSGVSLSYQNNYDNQLQAVVFLTVQNSAGQTVGISSASVSISSGATQSTFVILPLGLAHGAYTGQVFAVTTSNSPISTTAQVQINV